MNTIRKDQIIQNRALLDTYKAQLSDLTDIQYQVAIGVLLGDASLQSQDGGKTYRLKFEQGDVHKDYIEHLYSVFDEWSLNSPIVKERTNANNKVVISWAFQTISHSAFLSLAKIFLCRLDPKTGSYKKSIKEDFGEKYLSPRSLAYWFMDDGGKMDYTKNEGKGIVLNTHGFSHDEVEILSSALAKQFNLNCWVKKNKGKPVIAISGKCYEQMLDLIGDFVIPSMKNKFPSPRRPKKLMT